MNLVDANRYTDITLPSTAELEDASTAVLNFTDRDFGAPNVTEDRTFTYDGKGFLEIDDAEAVNSVDLFPWWIAGRDGPASVEVYSYLELPRLDSRRAVESLGAMGFMRNLDRWFASGDIRLQVTVNADWGWPVVPNDVQRAVILTAQGMGSAVDTGSGAELAGKSVAEVSEQFAIPQAQASGPSTDPLPDAALKILIPYRRTAL